MHNSGNINKVHDARGNLISGLYKKSDGSFINRNDTELNKSKKQQVAFETLNNKVHMLERQLQEILEKLNGKY